ncbi:glycoside hydrolase family 43 protein [Halobacillus salinarum]|uniref:Glycoside hydrolase family 43 protein n=1 Tax=Halobacillus salinarum TaxID=2932257 RepID=A0ABY4EHT5_9BACI|nr:glycoside hydrolase family 43 protein [Halobacillus salinarum]UOQ44034.1 glycoside hydrolase family 43 protein [Halobacillus salinarum]
MSTIENPILPGFHPDPSIVRVGDDYYIATSTFEWFPGVQIHHSKDLKHWRLLTYPLTRQSQLNMIGNIDSGGVWAPCLTYSDGRFYLIYTDVKSRRGAFKDTHNYLVTAENIDGPWSDPVYLNSSGFDPSLFHEDDGSKWLVNMIWDHRPGTNSFAGIALQEFSVEENRLIGPVKNIFKGTSVGLTEAPHIYKRNGYYYLMTAEGGTGYGHAVTVCRSKSLEGPYEVDPENPVLTSDRSKSMLQKAGHGSLVETKSGEWYMAHLCGRPIKESQCVLGRETALQKCYWTGDDWLRVEGGPYPKTSVSGPALESFEFEKESKRDDFDHDELSLHWNALRRPFTEDWISLTERPGYLRLKGQESMSSMHRQSILARRLDSIHANVETSVQYEPEHFQQMAGLIFYYDTKDYVYLRVTHHEEQGMCLGVIQSKYGHYEELLEKEITLPGQTSYYLKASVTHEWLSFYYSLDGENWDQVGEAIDFSHLADDDPDYVRFTGTFVGLCAQDLSGQEKCADFDYFIYDSEQS